MLLMIIALSARTSQTVGFTLWEQARLLHHFHALSQHALPQKSSPLHSRTGRGAHHIQGTSIPFCHTYSNLPKQAQS